MPKGNPYPTQSEEFKAKQFKAYGALPTDAPLSNKVTSIRLPQDVNDAVWALPDKERVAWLRRVISDAAYQELIEKF